MHFLVDPEPSVLPSIKLNLHAHTSHSDGMLTPEALVEALAEADVRVASLTDHDTLQGQKAFREALSNRGLGWISGLELSVQAEDGILHLLAYGFDLEAPALGKLMQKEGPVSLSEALTAIHSSGGCAFLAHPFEVESDLEKLRIRLESYKKQGLDGLEAVYAPYTHLQIFTLIDLARELDLGISGGSDFHGPTLPGLSDLAVHMPIEHWKDFRNRLFMAQRRVAREVRRTEFGDTASGYRASKASALDLKNFLLRILVPTLLAIALLVVPAFAYLIPAFESALLSRKREMIRELTASALSVLMDCHQDEREGRMTREEAQRAAANRIQHLRYGKEGKDYFWVTDLHPRMVMHPYRPELNGHDLQEYRDPRGHAVFVEFARLVQRQKEGYVEYVWQWKDDASRLSPKQSYVHLFEPWGWVIGTGLYIEDVKAEISALSRGLIWGTTIVALAIGLLLLFVAQQSFRLERRRSKAEEDLRQSQQRYRALAEASKEGAALVLEGRCIHANPVFLEMTAYREDQLSWMELDELFHIPENELPVTHWIQQVRVSESKEVRLQRADGQDVDVLLTVEPMEWGDRTGAILLLRDLRAHKEIQGALQESQARFRSVVQNLKIGVFRAAADPEWTLLELNPAAARFLGLPEENADQVPNMAALLQGRVDWESLRRPLLEKGELRDVLLHLGGVTLALTASLVRDENGDPRFVDAMLEDATVRTRQHLEKDALIAELQTALLFLGDPVKRASRPILGVELQTSIQKTADLMTQQAQGAVLVQGPQGEAVGIVTDHDLRERVLARHIDPGRPVFEIMSSPIVAVPERAQGHEALQLMRERNLQYLLIRDESGIPSGFVRGKDLVKVEHYPLALLVRTIREANRPDELKGIRNRLIQQLRALLESGARPERIFRSLATVSDAITQKLLALTETRLGPAPVPYAFLALGSEGREEQTLLSDQDNGLLYALGSKDEETYHHDYFRELGHAVSVGLEQAGYTPCRGGLMARNPRWCQPLDVWRTYFSAWIRSAEPQQVLEFKAFFDLRCVHGETELVADLRAHIRAQLAAYPSFFGHLAQECLQYKPSLGFLGQLLSSRRFNLKDAVQPIVNFARLYALHHGISATGTFERLRRLEEKEILSPSGQEEVLQGLDFLFNLRLRQQVERLSKGLSAEEDLDLRHLNHLEESLLKQVLATVGNLQKKISYDFLGGQG